MGFNMFKRMGFTGKEEDLKRILKIQTEPKTMKGDDLTPDP